MHMRTFKAKAAAKFLAANPDWKITETVLNANRSTNARGEESLTWGVRVQSGNSARQIWLHWSPSNGFWMAGGYA